MCMYSIAVMYRLVYLVLDEISSVHKARKSSGTLLCDHVTSSRDGPFETLKSHDVAKTQLQLSSLSERIDTLGIFVKTLVF